MQDTMTKIRKLISNPYEAPYEGEDYFIDDATETIEVIDTKVSGTICHRINNSGKFDRRLVKLNYSGDMITLGFDTLEDVDAIYETRIGYRDDTLAEIKESAEGEFCIYLNSKRSPKKFKSIKSAKMYLNKLSKVLKDQNTVNEYEYSEED